MLRTNCVICDTHLIDSLYTLENYPITSAPTNLDYSNDEFQDCIFMSCNLCGCIQIKNLIDPLKLYLNSHNSTAISKTWYEHHNEFATFIKSNNKLKELIEVGGNSGILYTLLCDSNINYTILDLSDTSTRPANINFVQGNCEDFDFSAYESLILSHTFEHLYDPRKFIQNLNNAKIMSLFVSIPNMESQCDTNNIAILNYEHTFFVGDSEIKFMFSQFNYECKVSYDFRKHSRFYHFVYNPNVNSKLTPNFTYRDKILDIFTNFSIKWNNIYTPCYICPAGIYGQKIHYYLNKFQACINGFIDNDPLKQNKRVYGTPLYVYSPKILETILYTKVYIVLYAGPYSNEIMNQLNMIHNNIEYINI